LEPEVLRQRLDKAAELHDILRTSFEYDDDGKIIGRVDGFHNIRTNSDSIGAIDPISSPLLALSLRDDKLTLRYHHIALDGWSVNLLIDELIHGTFPETAPSFA
jgi:hypothetical protein